MTVETWWVLTIVIQLLRQPRKVPGFTTENIPTVERGDK